MHINLITGSASTAKAIGAQLMRIFGSQIYIDAFLLEGKKRFDLNHHRLTVFSSNSVYESFSEDHREICFKDFIIVKRDIDLLKLEKMFSLPVDQKLLLVNDAKESADESVDSLRRLGFKYLDITPYYPGSNINVDDFRYAITNGEAHRVPPYIKNIIDLGSRVLDFGSVYSIMKSLNCCDEFIESIFENNNETLVKMAIKATKMSRENNMLLSVLKEKSHERGHKARNSFEGIIGRSDSLRKTKEMTRRLAKTQMTILIKGESGTGKELFANAIHNESSRKKFPFLAVNFSSLPDSLIESELFGYEEGSFTGAKKGGKKGLFELANGGTIFLDEIGDISLKMQTRLLRVIQEKEIMRIGSSNIISVDVRIVAATNKNLEEMIKNKEFREDLYYRLKVGQVEIYPLRERVEDIEDIAINEVNKAGLKITEKAISLITNLPWYGNVRELKNALECAIALSESGIIDEDDFMAFKGVCCQNPISNKTRDFLEIIQNLNSKNRLASRQSLMDIIGNEGKGVTEYQIRKMIDECVTKGLLRKREGTYGLQITEKGIGVI